ncbi:site-specific DNA-methyltransferase [Tenacibaculum piscium]|uniref:site-specific DNA-methyltransferase n=1 Tax=Tenacibaculum piscium TaxID=1458515 RepID=UPI001F1D25F9|nr:site-specific DNA-methyltransferase [Tenacibaculum piscium]
MSIHKIQQGDNLTQSKNLVADNIDKLKELFPEIFTEGKIDFKVLQDVLGENIEEEEDEYYCFTWAGKAQARREAHKPSTGTLRPVKEDSVDWDTTENVYIEGDNLEVLKLLQKSYAGKVKMIYIDPPYNTGKDFVYKDNYKDNLKNYQEVTGQVDSEGNKLSTNSDSDGRYHSNWLNMMYPRLRLARNLLKEDGVIFMSIDDNEVENLKKLGNEIFGEDNFVSSMIWQKKTGSSDAKNIATITEYVLVYAKNSEFLELNKNENAHDTKRFKYKDEYFEERGSFYYDNLDRGTLGYHKTLDYGVKTSNGNEAFPNGRTEQYNDGWRWKWGREKLNWGIKNGFVEVQESSTKACGFGVYYKIYLNVDNEGKPIIRSSPYKNLIHGILNSHASSEAKELFNKTGIFSNPKPTELIYNLLKLGADENNIILDFFSGSGTTAHSVLKFNADTDKKIKYIQVQLPEKTNEKSEAFKAGYKTITEIGKERIRRAGKKIAEENPEKVKNLDLGFKVFKLDSSNIKSWDGNPDNLEENLFDASDNIKTDRTEEDVLYEILLKYGLDLTLPIEEKIIEGKTVFNVGFGALFICLGDNLTNKVASGIGAWKEELQPEICRVIFKDTGFTDVEKTNSIQTLKRFGITEIKSI